MKRKPFKLTIPHIVGIVALIGASTGFIVKYGSIPESLASLKNEVDKQDEELQEYRNDVTEIQTEQRAIKEQTQQIYELLKNRR